MKHASKKLLSLALCLLLLAGFLPPARALALGPEGTTSPGQTRVGNGGAEVPLTVTFEKDNGGGTGTTENGMKTAIDAALDAHPFGNMANITTIKLTGDAAEITGYNWKYLVDQYQPDSGWDSLIALDLSGMTKLTTVKNGVNHFDYDVTKLQTLTLPSSLIQIGERAFGGCKNLDLQSLPNNVKQIGEYAFKNCESLTLQSLPVGLTQIEDCAFQNCKNLDLQFLPDSVEQIGAYAFDNCESLALQSLPVGLTQIGRHTFRDCRRLDLQSLPAGLTQIGAYAFYNCRSLALQSLPDGVSEIGEYAFGVCSDLALQELPTDLVQLGNRAFDGCPGITLTKLPEKLTSIGSQAFEDCTGLKNLTIPESVTNIGDSAFRGCTKLRSLTFEGSTAPTIGNDIFYGITPPPTVYVPDGATGNYPASLNPRPASEKSILTVTFENDNGGGTGADTNDMKTALDAALDAHPFGNMANITTIRLTGGAAEITDWNWRYLLTLYQTSSGWTSLTTLDLSGLGNLQRLEDNMYRASAIQNLQEVRFPSGLKTIGGNAFYNCIGLTKTAFPASLESIGGWAFSGCVALTGADLSACTRLTAIGDSAFSNCSSLTGELVLPAGLKSIGDWAFRGCSGLTGVTIPASLESIGDSAFVDCSGLTAFTVAAGNRQYAGRDGVLYSRDGKTLYQYPPKKAGTFAVPEGVAVIGNSAFYNCGGLTGVTFPESLESIEQMAFYQCNSLNTLTFLGDAPPATIDRLAFEDVSGPGTIYYPQGGAYTEDWQNTLKLTSGNWTLTPGWRLTVEGGTGSGIYQAETSVPITATPAGRTFDRWVQVGGSAERFADAYAESTTFTMPGSHVTVRAAYRATGGGGPASCALTASAGEGGTIDPSGTVDVAEGGSQEFTFTPQENWWLAGLEVDGTVQKAAGNSYTFADVTEDHSIRALFLPFADMNAGSWYAPDAAALYDRAIMRGVSGTEFGPNQTTSRGMIAAMLWRMEGSPEPKQSAGFTDVKPGAYYEKAVDWAAETGIASGYGNQTFGPNDAMTREQLAAVLYRYAQYKGMDVSARSDLSKFADAGEISTYAKEPMEWANAVGLVQGRTETELTPKGTATRAETAALLNRFLGLK